MDKVDTGTEDKKRKVSLFNVRESLGSVEAMKKYDKYLREHARRLRQLEKEARGEMSPSGDWHKEL